MTQANISVGEDAVSGAFGVGMDYFMANEEEQKRIAANNTTLQKEEWETLSETMISEYRRTIRGFEHLMDAGLTRQLSLATKVDLWQTRSSFSEAEVSMDGESRSDEDRITYDFQGVPIPIVHKDFRISDRDLQSSRNLGNDLQTDSVAEATHEVTETLDDMLFTGWSPTVRDANNNSFTLYGYTDHPDRIQFTADGDWDTDATAVRDDFVGFFDELDDNEREGPFWVYLNPRDWRRYRSAVDEEGDGNRTMRARIEEEFDQELDNVWRMPRLNEGEAVVVDPSPDVVELAVAEDVQLIEWQSGSGMTHQFKAMGAMAPEIKADTEGQSGVVHVTGL